MVKDIIVNLSVTKEGSVVGKYAVSVAAALQAHLTAPHMLAFRPRVKDMVVKTTLQVLQPA